MCVNIDCCLSCEGLCTSLIFAIPYLFQFGYMTRVRACEIHSISGLPLQLPGIQGRDTGDVLLCLGLGFGAGGILPSTWRGLERQAIFACFSNMQTMDKWEKQR